MIYTFSFDDEFLSSFKDKLDPKEAQTIFLFLITNFISRHNFYLKINAKRKNFFGRDTNGGNGAILKELLLRLGRKIKDFPSNIDKTDFTFSNKKSDYKENISFEKILKKSDDIENDLEKNCKHFWSYSRKDSDQKNKRFLEKKIEQLILYSDAIYFVDRHIPRTICKAKVKDPKSSDIRYYKSYSNSMEFYNSITKDKKSSNTFYCGITSEDYKNFVQDEGLKIVNILKEFFSKLKESNFTIKVVSGKQYGNPAMYKRLIIGLINNELFCMFRTDKGLDILDDKYQINSNKRNFELVDQSIAIDTWEDWKLVKYESPKIQFRVNI